MKGKKKRRSKERKKQELKGNMHRYIYPNIYIVICRKGECLPNPTIL